jgi:hypothetical protein
MLDAKFAEKLKALEYGSQKHDGFAAFLLQNDLRVRIDCNHNGAQRLIAGILEEPVNNHLVALVHTVESSDCKDSRRIPVYFVK